MRVLTLKVSEFKDGDIIIAEISGSLLGGPTREVQWGDTSQENEEGWVVSNIRLLTSPQSDIHHNRTKKHYVHAFNYTNKFKVLRATNDEPTEWGEMAL